MSRARLIAAALLAFAAGQASADRTDAAQAVYGVSGPVLRLATGSPGELGLVEALAVRFGDSEPIRLRWYKAGSGAALEMLKNGRVDLVMVHAPAAERAAVAAGWAARRTSVGGNAYYIVGPRNDPANIRESKDVLDALRRIATNGSRFVSRGDQSGTHRRELALWAEAGIDPRWRGYVETGDFMGASLRRADALGAYFLTDSSTWVVLQAELANLERLFSGDPLLANTYHGLLAPVGPASALANRFLDFISGPAGQAVIRDFGRDDHGEPLYFDAATVPAQR